MSGDKPHVTSEGLTVQRPQSCALLATRPGWHGKYHRGHRKCVQAAKREEARARVRARAIARERQQAVTP